MYLALDFGATNFGTIAQGVVAVVPVLRASASAS